MTLSATMAEGLEQYGVGPKLRALRTMKKMGLVQVAQHSGVSPALISKIERSKMYPTLPTLLRIAEVFSVGLDYFFTQKPPTISVVRKEDRQRSSESLNGQGSTHHFESLDFPAKDRELRAYVAEFYPSSVDDIKLHRHDGAEFLFVLEGALGLYVEDGETTLNAEDAAYFNAGRMHGYRRIGRKPCRALAVVSRRTQGKT